MANNDRPSKSLGFLKKNRSAYPSSSGKKQPWKISESEATENYDDADRVPSSTLGRPRKLVEDADYHTRPGGPFDKGGNSLDTSEDTFDRLPSSTLGLPRILHEDQDYHTRPGGIFGGGGTPMNTSEGSFERGGSPISEQFRMVGENPDHHLHPEALLSEPKPQPVPSSPEKPKSKSRKVVDTSQWNDWEWDGSIKCEYRSRQTKSGTWKYQYREAKAPVAPKPSTHALSTSNHSSSDPSSYSGESSKRYSDYSQKQSREEEYDDEEDEEEEQYEEPRILQNSRRQDLSKALYTVPYEIEDTRTMDTKFYPSTESYTQSRQDPPQPLQTSYILRAPESLSMQGSSFPRRVTENQPTPPTSYPSTAAYPASPGPYTTTQENQQLLTSQASSQIYQPRQESEPEPLSSNSPISRRGQGMPIVSYIPPPDLGGLELDDRGGLDEDINPNLGSPNATKGVKISESSNRRHEKGDKTTQNKKGKR